MKLLHTSDWHLGMSYRGGISYVEDQKYFIDQIIDIAKAQSVDGIIIAGDVFDKSISSKEALELYDYAITKMHTELDSKIFIIAGNHDGAERISSYSEILKKSDVYIAGSLSVNPYIINCQDVDIFLLPWITTDKVKTIYKDSAEQISSMEDAYKVVLDDYRSRFIPGHKNIIVSHAYIGSAETSESDRAAEIGKATIVSADVFDGFDYVALGHIHGPQQITENIRYCGTPMPYSFGKEEKQEKSVSIIDTDDLSISIVPLNLLHKKLTLTGTLDEILKTKYDSDILNGYLKIEITDSFVGLSTLSALKEKFINLFEVSGKSFEKDNAKITMTIDELENSSGDPKNIFMRYCEDILDEAPSEHFMKLFESALEEMEDEN